MGPDETTGTLYVMIDGERHELGPITKVKINLGEEIPGGPCVRTLRDTPEFTTTIRFPRMSRKRFIKLLMSHRYPRNEARAMAEAARREHIPYNTGYLMSFLAKGIIHPC